MCLTKLASLHFSCSLAISLMQSVARLRLCRCLARNLSIILDCLASRSVWTRCRHLQVLASENTPLEYLCRYDSERLQSHFCGSICISEHSSEIAEQQNIRDPIKYDPHFVKFIHRLSLDITNYSNLGPGQFWFGNLLFPCINNENNSRQSRIPGSSRFQVLYSLIMLCLAEETSPTRLFTYAMFIHDLSTCIRTFIWTTNVDTFTIDHRH